MIDPLSLILGASLGALLVLVALYIVKTDRR